MHFIEHIIEPTKLYLAWQPANEDSQIRFIVGELIKDDSGVSLKYFTGTKEFDEAIKSGFDGYLAYPDLNNVHTNVLDSFLRRIPPRERSDFAQYLEGLRLRPDAKLSDFALLGYSGAKLLSDEFSLIHPFENVVGPCEVLVEVTAFGHYCGNLPKKPHVGDVVSFQTEVDKNVREKAVSVAWDGRVVGYINRGLRNTVIDWIDQGRIKNVSVEKINGTIQRPALYVFVQVKGE